MHKYRRTVNIHPETDRWIRILHINILYHIYKKIYKLLYASINTYVRIWALVHTTIICRKCKIYKYFRIYRALKIYYEHYVFSITRSRTHTKRPKYIPTHIHTYRHIYIYIYLYKNINSPWHAIVYMFIDTCNIYKDV